MKTLLSLFITLFCAVQIFAAHPMVRNFNRNTMHAGTQNWDIVQYETGWLYFANNDGLLEFDGNRWTVFPIANHTNVRSLHCDTLTNRIYAGAFNEFGYYERNKNGLLAYHSLINSIDGNRNFNEIWKICARGGDDEILFQGNEEVFALKKGKIKRYNFQNRINSSDVVHNIYMVSVENEGILTQNGDLFVPLPDSEILKNIKICAILPFEKNKVLFVSDFNGIFIFDGEKTLPYKTHIDNFLAENKVFCACIKNNLLAIGTVRNGIAVYDTRSGESIFSNLACGLQNNTVLSLSFDFQGNLWLGLDKGIDYVQINSPIYDLFGNSQNYGAGYTSIVKGDKLYLGTNQGLYISHFPLQNSPQPAAVRLVPDMQGQIWNLRLLDGNIFCATDHGAFVIENSQVRKLAPLRGTWDFRQLKSRPNYILGSSYQGFFILKKTNGQWHFSHFVKGFTDNGGMFEDDEYGNLWFVHWVKGTFRLNFTSEKLDSFAVELFDTQKGFYTTRNNVLFRLNGNIVFSSDGGFWQYNKQDNIMHHDNVVEHRFGIFPTSVAMYEMQQGNVWLVKPDGVDFAKKDSSGTWKIDRNSFANLKNKLIPGFVSFNFIDNNSLIVNTESGFSLIDMNKHKQNEQHIEIAIRDVYLTGEKDSLIGGYMKHQSEIPKIDFINNSIRFEFVAAEYRSDASVTYSYFLENYDTDWSTFSAAATKEYTKLPKGDYIFRVKAQSILDSATAETSYHFSILPAWYESNLAFFIYFLLLMAALYATYRFVKHKSEKGAQRMKVQKDVEIKEQEERFLADAKEKEKEIVELKNQKLKYELRHKSRELSSSTMNLIRKNEMLLDIGKNIDKLSADIKNQTDTELLIKRLYKLQDDIKKNIERDDNWKKFEANFDLVYENYLARLGEQFPALTVSDKKLCAYLKMGLSSKDIAPLLNMSFRSVEMSRYRLRKKFDLQREANLTDFLQKF